MFGFRYIGTVSSRTVIMKREEELGTLHHRWILSEGPFGLRRAKFVGEKWSLSEAAMRRKADVAAWKRGGPLPQLDEHTKVKSAAPVLRLVK